MIISEITDRIMPSQLSGVGYDVKYNGYTNLIENNICLRGYNRILSSINNNIVNLHNNTNNWLEINKHTITGLLDIIEIEYNPIDNYDRTETTTTTRDPYTDNINYGQQKTTNVNGEHIITDVNGQQKTTNINGEQTITDVNGQQKTTNVNGEQTTTTQNGAQTNTNTQTRSAFNSESMVDVSGGSNTNGATTDSATVGAHTDTSTQDSYTNTRTSGAHTDTSTQDSYTDTHTSGTHTDTSTFDSHIDTTTHGLQKDTITSHIRGNIGVTTTMQMIESQIALLSNHAIINKIADMWLNDFTIGYYFED